MRRALLVLLALLWAGAVRATQVPIGPMLNYQDITSSSDPSLMDAAGEKVALVFRAPKAGDISGATIWLGTVTTGQGLTASLQDVNTTTGDPDGTQDQSGTVTVADTDDNVSKTFTFGTNRTVTRGEVVSLVIEWTGTAGNLNIDAGANGAAANIYVDHFTTVWTKRGFAWYGTIIYSDGSRAHIHEVIPGPVSNVTSFNSGTTPDERGNVFTVDAPITISGCMTRLDIDGDCDCVLYDTNGTTVLASGSVLRNLRGGTSSALIFIPFTSEAAIAAGSQYRLVIKPTTTTSAAIMEITVAVAADLDAWWFGSRMHKTERTDASPTWVETTTQMTAVWPIISGVGTDTGGGGGGILQLNKRGGRQQ